MNRKTMVMLSCLLSACSYDEPEDPPLRSLIKRFVVRNYFIDSLGTNCTRCGLFVLEQVDDVRLDTIRFCSALRIGDTLLLDWREHGPAANATRELSPSFCPADRSAAELLSE